jgi:hypothetical protein
MNVCVYVFVCVFCVYMFVYLRVCVRLFICACVSVLGIVSSSVGMYACVT